MVHDNGNRNLSLNLFDPLLRPRPGDRSGPVPSLFQARGMALFSDPEGLLGRLRRLWARDPEQCRKVLRRIAFKFREQAAEAGDTRQGDILRLMAERFDEAAVKGDLNGIMPWLPRPRASGSGGRARTKGGRV